MKAVDSRLLRYASAVRGYLLVTVGLGLAATALILAQVVLRFCELDDGTATIDGASLRRPLLADVGPAACLGAPDRAGRLAEGRVSMADANVDQEAQHAAEVRRRYLVQFEEDMLKSRPLWIRLIIEFAGTFLLVTVAAGSGVINHYVGGGPISRTAAVVAPGALVMALIYAWGPLSGLHINPAVTAAFAGRGVFPRTWVLPYWAAQFAGAIGAALFLQSMYGDVSAGGNYPISRQGGDWRSFVMEIVLTAILVSVILHTATGGRSIGHNAAIAVGATVALLGLFASPISGSSMNPARTLGPDIVGANLTGWWVYVFGDLIGAVIAVGLIGLVRGLPDKSESEAAEGDLPRR